MNLETLFPLNSASSAMSIEYVGWAAILICHVNGVQRKGGVGAAILIHTWGRLLIVYCQNTFFVPVCTAPLLFYKMISAFMW